MNRLSNILPGWLTASGAAAVIVNAVGGYLTGSMSGREALFQGGIGVIGIGLRRAIGRVGNQ